MEEYFRRTQNSWCVQRGWFFAEKNDDPKSVILIVQFSTWLLSMIRYIRKTAYGGTSGPIGRLSMRETETSNGSPKAFIYLFGSQRIELSGLEKKYCGQGDLQLVIH